MFGFTEEQVSGFGMTVGIGLLVLFMLFIIGELAWRSKVGKTGTFVLFFVLALGMSGFLVKFIIKRFLEF